MSVKAIICILTACFIALDMITGIVKAFKEKNFTSTLMREGLFHKCGSVLTVVFGFLVDYAQGVVDLGFTVPLGVSFCVYIILMECGSIMENIGKINPEILPEKLQAYFSKLKKG